MSKGLLNKAELQYFFESRRKFDKVISDIMGGELEMTQFTADIPALNTFMNGKISNIPEKQDKNSQIKQRNYFIKVKQLEEELDKLKKKVDCWEKTKQFMEKHHEKLNIKPCKFRNSDEKLWEQASQKLQKLLQKNKKIQSDYEIEKYLPKQPRESRELRSSQKKKVTQKAQKSEKAIKKQEEHEKMINLNEDLMDKNKKLEFRVNQLEFQKFEKQIQNQNLHERLKELQIKYLSLDSKKVKATNCSSFEPVVQNFQLELLLQRDQLEGDIQTLKKELQGLKTINEKYLKIIEKAKQLNETFMKRLQTLTQDSSQDQYYKKENESKNMRQLQKTKLSLRSTNFKIIKSKSCTKGKYI